MTLPFSTELNGKPTQFVEKIWQGLLTNDLEFSLFDLPNFLDSVPGLKDYKVGDLPAKLHTIRKDEKDHWREGRDIHMVIHNRTPNRLQFAPVVKCVSVQKIEIKEFLMTSTLDCVVVADRIFKVKIDDRWLAADDIQRLSINDGFETIDDLIWYFNGDFIGKIIHWTKLKY